MRVPRVWVHGGLVIAKLFRAILVSGKTGQGPLEFSHGRQARRRQAQNKVRDMKKGWVK